MSGTVLTVGFGGGGGGDVFGPAASGDARYVRRPLLHRVGVLIEGGTQAITTGEKASVQLDFAGTITGWSILADQAGSVSVDICRKAGTETAPGVPNTTTDKISASAPVNLAAAQSKGVAAAGLTGWTTALAKWDTLLFNVTAAETVTRVVIVLRIQE